MSLTSFHRGRDFGGFVVLFTEQAGHHAAAVGLGTVLAQLRLALDPGDGDLDPDDARELTVDELLRGVAGRPRLIAAALVDPGQSGDDAAEPLLVPMDSHGAGQMYCGVVPGRDDPAVFGLRRVPGRADVGLGSRTDQQRRAAGVMASIAGWRAPCGQGRRPRCHMIGNRVATGSPSGSTVTNSADRAAATKRRISSSSSIRLKDGVYILCPRGR